MKREEALKILKDFHDNSALFSVRTALDTIIPELKESEDERIRKTLIKGFQHYDKECKWGEFTTTEILSWLEKQGETFTKKDVDDAYLKGVCDAKQELEKQGKEEYALKSCKDEDVRKFMQQIKKEAESYEFNLPNRDYDIYAFAKDILAWLEKQGVQKTAWSEEDSEWYMVVKESILERWRETDNKDLIELRDGALDWLKSLKDRVCLQPKQGEQESLF